MNDKLDQNLANEYYKKGYVSGYRRADKRNDIPEFQSQGDDIFLETPYLSITYRTAVIILLLIFIIFVVLSHDLNYRPEYVSRYEDPCLLKISSTYSGADCI